MSNKPIVTTNPKKVEAQTKAVHDLAKEKEILLNELERNKDYSKMFKLDLGDQENYKTKMV